ncbi:hypothetical protein FEM48_Zijuj01G0081900 [Ziziphus jujuba var. spinosa]|uniref:Disease resistance RPP13-like protein 4 n=1 Tax=Ziziphus jujuba var. spinosa TaxID=714518 RepID=A0A978W045_ZIZJJ|nr:hypothetical protein FEM48_Zijuj01G0081900 [Ziziphus jujuba var. spinosa]
MSMVEAMLQILMEQIYAAVNNKVQFALDFKVEFDKMKSRLDLMTAFMTDTENLKTKNEVAKAALIKLREVIYDADNILTDCIVRDEYKKDGSCFGLSLSDPLFLHKTSKKLKDINTKMEQIEKSLGGFQRAPHQNNVQIEDSNHARGFIAFSKEHVVKCMLDRLDKKVSGFDSSQLFGELQQVLADKTCLIVMDDVREMDVEWWTTLCSIFPKRDGKSSCIIITTRNEDVANDMGVENSKIHRPPFLNDNDSWSLFSKFAFSSNKGICPPRNGFEEIGKDIVKKCGGLPLAIKTIGALLARNIESPADWAQIRESFHDLTTEGRNKSVMASLQLSYDELPSHLKQCLLSFSIYPIDLEVRSEELIHWWVAEGLVQGKGSKSAVEMGYEYLLQLVKRCLVQAVQQRRYDGRIYDCKIHDMVRELISMNAQEEAFCSFDEKGRQTLNAEFRWLGLCDSMHGKPLGNKSKTRALMFLVSNDTKLDFGKFGLLTSLRMLDFSYSNLKEMRAEDLCADLKRIHQSITSLRKLIVLDLGSCPLENLPRGLGRLSYLQELSGFMVTSQLKRNCCKLIELGELKHIRVLRISISDDTEILENELDVLAHLGNLKVLAIDADNCKRNTLEILKKVDQLIPPPALQELYLRNYHRTTLPLWVCSSRLTKLQYLSIENGDLIKLTAEVEDGNCHAAWNIEGLYLKFLTRLDVNWTDLQKDMPVLRYMGVSNCYKLKGFPCSVKSQAIWRKNQDSGIDSLEDNHNIQKELQESTSAWLPEVLEEGTQLSVTTLTTSNTVGGYMKFPCASVDCKTNRQSRQGKTSLELLCDLAVLPASKQLTNVRS